MSKRGYQEYSADTKHFILTQYKRGVRGCGFHALAIKYGVPSGARTVENWYSMWDGTPASLQKHTTSHKRRRLKPGEVQQHIRQHVIDMNREGTCVKYKDVKKNVEEKTGAPIAYSTLKQYGYKEANISWKRTSCTLNADGM